MGREMKQQTKQVWRQMYGVWLEGWGWWASNDVVFATPCLEVARAQAEWLRRERSLHGVAKAINADGEPGHPFEVK